MAIIEPIMSVAELDTFMDEAFPQMREGGGAAIHRSGAYAPGGGAAIHRSGAYAPGGGLNVIEAVGPSTARLRLRYSERNLRPGGTISGPAMMALADYAMYAVVLAHIGPVALAVTTNFTINFLRKPAPADVVAEARLLKLGRRLAVGEVTMTQVGQDGPVAHVTSTYSIPSD